MRFILFLALTITATSLPQRVDGQTTNETQSEVVKKLAEQMANATQKGDYKKIVTLTHKNVLEQLGGTARALETIKAQMDMMKQRDMKITQFKIGKLQAFASTADNKIITT